MSAAGRLVIMGSGETAPTMIKIHRALLESIPEGRAVLLDTPYGFQENADDITARAQHYFRTSVGREVTSAGWRTADLDDVARERALTAVRAAEWVFAGPGSPTYALGVWQDTPLPGLLRETVTSGGTLVFASAAALTLGSHTVPVYEIYKAGIAPHWEHGLDLMNDLTGLPAVVIPHYDNAEGGHHDTRFCYLGERRLAALERELPDEGFVFGVDEHTAVILEVGAGTVSVVGNGVLTIRHRGVSVVHPSGTVLALGDLASAAGAPSAGSLPNLPVADAEPGGSGANRPSEALSLRAAADHCQARFTSALAERDADAAIAAVLELETVIHDWAGDTLSSDDGDHARGLLRSMVVELGGLARNGVADPAEALRPYIDLLITLREQAREAKDFSASDEIRDALASAGVEVRDTPAGSEWSLAPNRLSPD